MHPSSLHPSNSYTHHFPSYAATMLNPVCQCQSLYLVDKLNNLTPSSTTTSTATQTALPTEAALHPEPSIKLLPYHQAPPKSPNTQQNLGKVLTTQAWTTRNVHILCTDPIQSTLLPSLKLATKPIFSTPHPSLMPGQLMHRLWKELTFTMTLLDCLSNMILIDATSNQPSNPNFFELLTNLPQINPKALLANLSHISDPAKHCLQVPPTCNQYWHQPKSLECIKTCNTHYLSILLWFLLQFTPLYAKDLLKVP